MIGTPSRTSLAAVAEVARTVQGAHGSDTLSFRICQAVASSLGFDRVTLMRTSADDVRVELLAAHGLPLHDSTGRTKADASKVFRRARATGGPVLAENRSRATGVAVVVPLFSGSECLGFLAAARDEASPELESSEQELLITLGSVVAAFLEQAIVQDDLLNTLRLRSEFIALASHELRAPAALVCGAAATLRERAQALRLKEKRDLLRVLHEQSERLHALVEQLLDLSRLDATSVRIAPVRLAVRERTEEIVRGVAADRGDAIEIRIEPGLQVAADPEAFDRIVSNLITNAFRYGQPPITVSAAANDRHFRLAVEDRGRGVAPEFAPRLFDRFTREEGSIEPGVGLGLSIAQSYAHAHGGQLVYTDAKPRGARFELVVPIRAPGSVARRGGKAGTTLFHSKQTVWIHGRAASFCYAVEPASAVIRYDGESETRVVPLHKLASAPPTAS